jgi:signal transduction histidine kinase
MLLTDFISHLTSFGFLALTVYAMGDYARHPSSLKLEIALLFGCFAPILFLSEFRNAGREVAAWVSALGSAALLAHPFLLLRLVRRFHSVPRPSIWVGGVLWAASSALVVLSPSPLPVGPTLVVVGYFVGIEGYAVFGMLRGARKAGGLTRRRLYLAAAGSGILGSIIFLAGVSTAVPEVRSAVGPTSQLGALGSAAAYYFAFAAPRSMRRYWQFQEVFAYLTALSASEAEVRLARAMEWIAPTVRRALGAVGSALWLVPSRAASELRLKAWDPADQPPAENERGRALLQEVMGSGTLRILRVGHDFDAPFAATAAELDAHWLRLVPVAGATGPRGVLGIFQRVESFFPEDDDAFLTLFVERAADLLEQSALLERHRELLSEVQFANEKLVNEIAIRNAAEGEVRELNRALQQQVGEREAAFRELEAFSYSVSHDLRAPLRSVHGFSRILMEEFSHSLPEAARRYLDLIAANARKMGALIDDLLEFSRLGRQALQRAPLDTASMVRAVMDELLVHEDGRDIELVLGDLPPSLADARMMRLVWGNLLSNAVKFTRPRASTVVEVGSTPGDDGPTYFVKDNGVGFDSQYADKLFGVFQRLHRAEDFEGTGVGLAIVQRVVERHGGRAWAASQPEAGATFFFELGKEANSLGTGS